MLNMKRIKTLAFSKGLHTFRSKSELRTLKIKDFSDRVRFHNAYTNKITPIELKDNKEDDQDE